MTALISSFLLVVAAEIGDKTQLLALVLAARFRAPWTIMAGILAATLLNHGLASWLGGYMAVHVDAAILKYALAALFFVFGIWILFPDKDSEGPRAGKWGAFVTTLVVFFLAEMGDKTQLATVALGAKYGAPVLVTIGTTLGMLVADGLVVFFGEALTRKIPLPAIRKIACALFVAFGIAILIGF